MGASSSRLLSSRRRIEGRAEEIAGLGTIRVAETFDPSSSPGVERPEAETTADGLRRQPERTTCRSDVYGRAVPISGPGFYAGVVVYRGQVVETAPILRKHLRGKSLDEMIAIVKKKGWKLDFPDLSPPEE